jgi:PiT family inorganic phosphate transporter
MGQLVTYWSIPGDHSIDTFIILLMIGAACIAFYMAWNIGANDVANAMGTSVGSGAITLKQAVIIAAVLEFSGAVLVGSHVANAHRVDIVKPDVFVSDPELLMYGMVAALLASAFWITMATYYSMPVSTTHSIVGAIMGFGIAAFGPGAIQVAGVSKIIISWVVSPLCGAAIAFVIFIFVRRQILNSENPVRMTEKVVPPIVGLVFFIITLSAIYKGLKNLHLDLALFEALALAAIIGIISMFAAFALLNRVQFDQKEPLKSVEKIFAYLQVMSACYVAFAHGANDVGNAIGPLATTISIALTMGDAGGASVPNQTIIPLWVLVLGGAGITIGVLTWGKKVIRTIGSKITDITPTRGFSAEFGAATTVLICSKLGLPISTTHTLVGAVIGVGFAGGLAALDLRIIGKIIVSWLVTLPIAAFTSIGIFLVIRLIVGV